MKFPMSKVVNLNKVRKLKAREAAEKLAAENRVKFGRTKAQKQLDEAEAALAKARLDARKRDDSSKD